MPQPAERPAWQRMAIRMAATRAGSWFYVNVARLIIVASRGGDPRERLWRLAADQYAGYETYQGRAGRRRIPVMVLEPAQAGWGTTGSV